MDPDDLAYRKSVRNMIFVLAVMAVTIFAAIFIPPYVNPMHNVYRPSVTLGSPYGFALHLTVNRTSNQPVWGVVITGWINSTSSQIENITASDSWAFPESARAGGLLWTMMACTPGWPIGLGVMEGHYTQDNYTQGSLLPLNQALHPCPHSTYTPGSYALAPLSSKALVVLNGAPAYWVVQMSLQFTATTPGYQLPSGVYTAVLADEWGDVLTTNFLAT